MSSSCAVGGLVACFVVLMNVAAMAGATQYKVGGDGGWGVPDAGAESYNTWAEKTSFQIGDQLLFVYPKDKDSVLELEPADYNSCNTASYDKKFADGSTVFDLDRAGAFFFISGVDDKYCRANEKLIVMVANATTTSSSSPPPPSSSFSSSPPSSPSSGGGAPVGGAPATGAGSTPANGRAGAKSGAAGLTVAAAIAYVALAI